VVIERSMSARLYKAELIHRRAPWKTREAVELATLEWMAWFNHHRLLEPLGYMPPAWCVPNTNPISALSSGMSGMT
jgi:transposase InsO family protein